MKSNTETVEELRKHVDTLKDGVLEPIQEYARTGAGGTMPPELDKTVQLLISYVTHSESHCILRSSHLLCSELSQLTAKWEKFRERGKFSRFLTRDKDEAALRTFAEGVGRVLQRFQVNNLTGLADAC